MNRYCQGPVAAVCLLLLATFLVGCSPATPRRQDPLVGRIFDTRSGSELRYERLFDRIRSAEVIYLGENHDNAEHHRIQSKIIRDLIKAGKKPQLGFEFFSIDQTGYLKSYVDLPEKGGHKFPAGLLEQRLRRDLGWQDRSDREWQFYFGLVSLAREHKLTVFGADLPRGIIRSISRNGMEGLTPVEAQLIRSTNFRDDDYRQLMYDIFRASHCGFAMKSHREKMYQTWLARNDTMARSIFAMIQAHPEQPVVIILGGGHTGYDMGVYERVAYLSPGTRQLNVGLQEIFRRPAPLEAYLESRSVGQRRFPPSHQYLWFTQRHSYQDPCERFRKHLAGMKKAGAE